MRLRRHHDKEAHALQQRVWHSELEALRARQPYRVWFPEPFSNHSKSVLGTQSSEFDPGLGFDAGAEGVFHLLHFGDEIGQFGQLVLGVAVARRGGTIQIPANQDFTHPRESMLLSYTFIGAKKQRTPFALSCAPVPSLLKHAQ